MFTVIVAQPLVGLIKRVAPALKVALAGLYHDEVGKVDGHMGGGLLPATLSRLHFVLRRRYVTVDIIDDWSVFVQPALPPQGAVQHRLKRPELKTTLYVCCGPAMPNTFTASPPVQACCCSFFIPT